MTHPRRGGSYAERERLASRSAQAATALFQSQPCSTSPQCSGPLNSTPLSDLQDSDIRNSQSFLHLQALAEHPQRIAHLSFVIPLLNLNDRAWENVRQLRKDPDTAAVLSHAFWHLYQIPDDIFRHIEALRSAPTWESIKDLTIQAVGVGTLVSPERSESLPLSRWSPRSSGRSSNSLFSTLSAPSSHNSLLSIRSARMPRHTSSSSKASCVDDDSPWPLQPSHKVHCRWCGKLYTRPGDLHNHILTKHVDMVEASGPDVIPETPVSQHQVPDGMEQAAHTQGAAFSGQTAVKQYAFAAADANDWYRGSGAPEFSDEELVDLNMEEPPILDLPINRSEEYDARMTEMGYDSAAIATSTLEVQTLHNKSSQRSPKSSTKWI